jgi:hypothetical protein
MAVDIGPQCVCGRGDDAMTTDVPVDMVLIRSGGIHVLYPVPMIIVPL